MAGLRRAVIIGVNEYKAAEIGNLHGAVQDAEELRKILVQNDNFTIPYEHFLTNERATADNIRAAISDVFYKADDRCEIALLYFAGHGRKDRLDYGWLLPHDCDHTAPFVRGIRIQELKQLFVNPKLYIDTGIMILDCCYSGIATQAEGTRGVEDVDMDSFQKEFQLESTGSGRFILASARANETAREIKQKHALTGEEHVHGAYSFHLIEGLETGACDEFGCVSLAELINYLDTKFESTDVKHRPQFYASGSGASGIELTRRPERVKEELEKKYKDIEEYLGIGSPTALIIAADSVEAIRLLGDQIKMEEYKRNIVECFEGWAPIIYNWWVERYDKIFRETKNIPGYEILEGILPKAEFKNVHQLPANDRRFVIQVMEGVLRSLAAPAPKAPDDEIQLVVQHIRKFARSVPHEPFKFASPAYRAGV